MTSSQAQQKVINDKKINYNNKNAFKEACCRFQMERSKTGKGKKRSAQDCCDKIGKKYNVAISARTVQHYVHHGQAGESPMKQGPEGSLCPNDFKILTMAFETFIRIKQIKGETAVNTWSLLAK